MSEGAAYGVGDETAARKGLGKRDREIARQIARAIAALGADPRLED